MPSKPPQHLLRVTARRTPSSRSQGGVDMELLILPLSIPALVWAAGRFIALVLPLVSDRANKRAVQLAKAKNKSK